MVSRHSSAPLTGPRTPAAQNRPVQLVGRRVRRLRKDLRLTLEDLASSAGIQAADLSRLEKGEYRASLDVLFRILGALGVNGEAFCAELAREASTAHGAIPQL